MNTEQTTILCDLVLLSWNNWEETDACLESLLASTRVPCRLFIVDNGSEAPVRQALAQIKPRGAIREVVLLQNEINEGFPRGMNRGIQASASPYVCLLNNDLRFTVGWMHEMMEVARANPEIGLVNPTSSTFGNFPPKGVSLQRYADALRARTGEFVEVGMCIGFCVLIKREVLQRLGGLSEEVERIFFEDEDFSVRAQRAGFRSVVASAAYVYHAEHRTVRKMPEREALFARNQRWCHERWGRWVRMAWPHFEPLVPGSAELRAWLQRLQGWTRRRIHVYVYCAMPPGVSSVELFRSVGLTPHADIHWNPIPEPLARWATAAHILKRRKKPFDIVAAPDDRFAAWMKRLKPLHRAEVIPQDDDERLAAVWQAKARVPSSVQGASAQGPVAAIR